MSSSQYKNLIAFLILLSMTSMSNSLLSPLQQKQQQGRSRNVKLSTASSSRKSPSAPNSNRSDDRNSGRNRQLLYHSMNPANLEFEDSDKDKSNNVQMSSLPSRMFKTLSHRAGAVVERNNNNNKSRQELIMAAALFATYCAVMGAKCALPSTYALITSDQSGLMLQNAADSNPQAIMAKVLTLSTCAIAFGKFLLGPIIDRFGGVLCLKVSISALGILLVIISSTNTFKTFAVAWVMVDFIFSSCWAACLNTIHHSFSQDQWASSIGQLAVAARVGNASSFLFFSWLLEWSQQRRISTGGLVGQSWRTIFWASALMQIVPITLLMLSHCLSDWHNVI